MAEEETFTVDLVTTSGKSYANARLRDKHELRSDEPEWLPEPIAGDDEYPAPVDFLLMSLASCQSSVLNQCLETNGIDDFRIECEAILDDYEQIEDLPDEMPQHTASRIGHILVEMVLYTTPEYEARADRCLSVYDDGCIVGQSLSGGIDYTPVTSLKVVENPTDGR